MGALDHMRKDIVLVVVEVAVVSVAVVDIGVRIAVATRQVVVPTKLVVGAGIAPTTVTTE
jgi:hypothetical protein